MSNPRGKYTTEKCQRCGSIGRVVDPHWLRAERQDAEITLREMARRLGVSATYLSDIERGRRSAMPRIVAAYEGIAGIPEEVAKACEDEDDDSSSVIECACDAWSPPLRRPVEPKILSTDDFYALLRILEVLPIADPFITALQSKLSDEERRQHGSRASHLSGPEFAREIERIEALIQSRVDGVLRGSGSPQEEHP